MRCTIRPPSTLGVAHRNTVDITEFKYNQILRERWLLLNALIHLMRILEVIIFGTPTLLVSLFQPLPTLARKFQKFFAYIVKFLGAMDLQKKLDHHRQFSTFFMIIQVG